MKKLLCLALFFTVASRPNFAATANITYCKYEEYCVAANNDCTSASSPCGAGYEAAPTIGTPSPPSPITCNISVPVASSNADSNTDDAGTISKIDCDLQ